MKEKKRETHRNCHRIRKKTVAISSLLVEEYEKSENADVSVSDKLPGCLALSTLAKETGH